MEVKVQRAIDEAVSAGQRATGNGHYRHEPRPAGAGGRRGRLFQRPDRGDPSDPILTFSALPALPG